MKRKIILSLITICILSFASCGNSTTEEPETTVTVETTAEATPEPTVTPEPTATPNVETGTVEESTDSTSTESKAEINENDSQTSEGEAIEEVVKTPASDTSNNTGYTLDEESKAFLKQMGATDAELNNVKSDKDLDNLINNLSSRLYGNGGGSSTAGGSSSSADTGSSGATGEDVRDPSRDFQLLPADQTLPGSM